MTIINLNQNENFSSLSFNNLLKKPSDCTDQACPSGAYFVEQNDGKSLYDLGTRVGGPQSTILAGKTNEWSAARYAILIAEGNYEMPGYFKVGYYTQISGVSEDQDSVVVSPGINVLNNCAKAFNADGTQNDKCDSPGGLDNFWRTLSDIKMNIGSDGALRYAVSQASPIRDVTIEGNAGILMCDWDTASYACGMTSGGFIDGMKASSIGLGSQQQFYVSNSQSDKLIAGVWNVVSDNNNIGSKSGEGDKNVQNKWPGYPFTEVHDNTLAQSHKKPKLVKDHDEWHVKYDNEAKSISDFIILQLNQNEDRTTISASDIQKINSELANNNKAGIIVMPGIYDLEDTLNIPNNKIVLVLGIPSLVCPITTGKCMITGSEGVRLYGMVFDAPKASSFDTNQDAVLLNIGEKIRVCLQILLYYKIYIAELLICIRIKKMLQHIVV